jgi:preprotein translocase subunit SecD
MKTRGWLLVVIVVALGAVFLSWLFWPTVKWYGFTSKADRVLAASTRTRIRAYAQEKADLAVDELAALSMNSPLPDGYTYLIKMANARYEAAKKQPPSSWRVRDVLSAYSSREEFASDIEAHFRSPILKLKDLHSDVLQIDRQEAGISALLRVNFDALDRIAQRKLTAKEKQKAFRETREVMQDRIEGFMFSANSRGMYRVTATLKSLRRRIGQILFPKYSIRMMNPDLVAVEMRGTQDTEGAQESVFNVGLLTFRLVDDDALAKVKKYAEQTWGFILEGFDAAGDVTDAKLLSLIPAGEKLLGVYKKDPYGIDRLAGYTVVHLEVVLSGMDIVECSASRSPVAGSFETYLSLTTDAAASFDDFTRRNVGKTLAIIVGKKVRFQGRITGLIQGQIALTHSTEEESNDLINALRVGSIPVPLEIIREKGDNLLIVTSARFTRVAQPAF